MKQNLDKLNDLAQKYIQQYIQLDVDGRVIATPHYINRIQGFYTSIFKKLGLEQAIIDRINNEYKNMTVPYGWYRGKGTPEQLVIAIQQIAIQNKIELKKINAETLVDFMRLFGIGVDCSGFVFNTLSAVFGEARLSDLFIDSFNWQEIDTLDGTRKAVGVNYADCNMFAASTNIVEIEDIKPLDLILVRRSSDYDYLHIAMVVKGIDNHLCLAESALNHPSVVSVSELNLNNKRLIINDKDRYDGYEVEARRLKFLM